MIKKGNTMIKVENLSFSFPQKDLYKNISFTLEEGQHCAFIGTSGSGKSTLIDIIMDPERYMFDGKLEIDPNLQNWVCKSVLTTRQNKRNNCF